MNSKLPNIKWTIKSICFFFNFFFFFVKDLRNKCETASGIKMNANFEQKADHVQETVGSLWN